MRSRTKSIYWITVLALFLASVVFTGTGTAKTNSGDSFRIELAEAKAKMKSELAKVQATARTQAKARAKERSQIEQDYKNALARIGSDYKAANKKIEKRAKDAGLDGLGALFADKKKAGILKSIKREKAKTRAQYEEAKTKAKAEYRRAITALELTSKSDAKQTAREKAKITKEYKAQKAETDSKLSARKIAAKTEAGQDRKAKEKERKQIKGARERPKVEKKAALAKAKREKKLKLSELQAKTKADSRAIAAESASIEKQYKRAKAEAELQYKKTKKVKSKAGEAAADYKQAKAKAEADYRKAKWELGLRKKEFAAKTAEEKAQIEAEYQEAVSKANLKFRRDAKAPSARLDVSKDTSQKFLVKVLEIKGNSLISTGQLLQKLPVVYTSSEQKGETTTKTTYDFRVLHELIIDPGKEREVSHNTVKALTQYILSVYRKKGYAGIYVYVPKEVVKGPTELKDGILLVSVLEAKVANVTIKRYDFDRREVKREVLKSSVLESWSPVKKGQVLKEKELDDFVRLLNLNPDRYISGVVSKGDRPNTLNMGYDVYEANPWHWYAQVDNSGTDKREWSPRVGLINTNLTGRDDRLSFMYQAKPNELSDNYAYVGRYEFPFLSPRLRLGVFGGQSKFDLIPEAGGGLNFRGGGSFYGGTLRYNMFQVKDWMFDFCASVSQEESEVIPSMFKKWLSANVRMDLYSLGVEVHRSTDMSKTSIGFNRVQSMGGSNKTAFLKARMGAEPDFAIDTIFASHRQFLDENKVHRLSGSLRCIMPDERLIPAKMTTFGGMYSVRGYEEDGIVADGGVLASLQYEFDLVKHGEYRRSDKTKTGKSQGKKPLVRKLAPLCFFDYGRAKMKNEVPGEKGAQELYSVGVGLLTTLGDHFDAALYYGYPLKEADETGEGNGRLNLSFIYRW